MTSKLTLKGFLALIKYKLGFWKPKNPSGFTTDSYIYSHKHINYSVDTKH